MTSKEIEVEYARRFRDSAYALLIDAVRFPASCDGQCKDGTQCWDTFKQVALRYGEACHQLGALEGPRPKLKRARLPDNPPVLG